MKFCFLSSYAHLVLDPKSDRVSGGAELQVALLARELVGRGHEVVIIGGDIGQKDEVFDGVRTRNGGPFQTGALLDTMKAVPRVLRILAEERPDYVLILGWTTWLYLLHVVKRRRYRLVFICGLDTEVNGEFRRENPARGAILERGIREADVRFAMSTYQAEQFARQELECGFYRNLILPRSTPMPGEKSVDLLWIARCQPIKRPHLFLDLAERLPKARCEMVCPREDVGLWETVAARARTMPNVKFIERVPYHEVQSHYDSAKIFVNTSTFEGWPNSFIQAGMGGAALASLSVNSDDFFARFEPGVFADGDFEKLVGRVTAVLDDTIALSAAQNGARRFVAELHDNARNVDAFLEGLNC